MPKFAESSFTYDFNKTISYLSAGPSDGPLLIFMHGFPAIAQVWHPQISAFAGLGFHVVAPDMLGYNNSYHEKGDHATYSIESNVAAMMALLSHLSRPSAVWIAHDWGTGPLWGLASHHPEVVRAAVAMTIPYRTMDLGLEELVKLVDRDIYPEERYPYGQWGYQAYYEQHFDAATAWFERDNSGATKVMFANRGVSANLTQRARTTDVLRDGGWLGGSARPPPASDVPEHLNVLDDETLATVTAAMQHTGWWAPNSWYLNHKRNRTYMLEGLVNGGKLDMPVLFIEALWDAVCTTANSDLAKPMKEYVADLTYVSIEAGHWVATEKPMEVNAAVAKWLVEKVGDWWPKLDVKA